MNWKDSSEIVAILAIVISLLLLAYELKRSNDIAEAEAMAVVASAVNEFNQQIAGDRDMADVWLSGLVDYDSLDGPSEQRQFMALWEVMLNNFETSYKYYEQGIIDAADAEFLAQNLCNAIGSESSTRIWHQRRNQRIPGFYDFISENCDLSVP